MTNSKTPVQLMLDGENFKKIETIANLLKWTINEVICAMLDDGIAQASVKMKCFNIREDNAKTSRNTDQPI